MLVPEWIWYIFIFAFGCCIGSFLNVVIYRLPREKSLVRPASACPACGRAIRFYDNIPLISWIVLLGRCRYCKARISVRYFIIELLTGVVFLGLFILYFRYGLLKGVESFMQGGWLIYLLHIVMLAAFIAASAIDLELWIIPISICWLVTAVGLAGSAVGEFVIEPAKISGFRLLPTASADLAALSLGAAIGLVVALILLVKGVIKRSYDFEVESEVAAPNFGYSEEEKAGSEPETDSDGHKISHRIEVLKEVLFLAPIIACSLVAYILLRKTAFFGDLWLNFSQKAYISGFFGSLFGYFVGCGVVWAVRILGTLGFGKEAMGLGDVHLMGAAGAVLGAIPAVAGFFIAPFFGLAWACFQMFFKKCRQIPYGPFLSLGIFIAIMLHDWIFGYVNMLLYR